MKKVEFKDLYTVKGYGCGDCIFKGVRGCESEAVELITGINCAKEGIIFKRKPKYEICTEDNTNVGDTIQYTFVIDDYRKYRVEYLYQFENKAVVSHNSTGREKVVNLKDCKVEIK